MLRFYYMKIGDRQYRILNEPIFPDMESLTVSEDGKANFLEIFIDPLPKNNKFGAYYEGPSQELNVTFVKEEALKAADDHNRYILDTFEEDNRNARDLKQPALEVVERLLHFPDFKTELDGLLNRFPMPEHHVPAGTKIIG